VPIWRCDECKEYDVMGSFSELKQKAGNLPKDFHKPWIDKITYKCETCNKGTKKRIPDILDVWIDAGTTSWTCLKYPKKTEEFEKLFPADLILEGKDQIRGWFNLLLIASFLAFEKHPYKAVYMHGFINDSQGRKMSKSLQNYILPSEVVDKYGADTLRYYTIGAANPGMDMNYNFDDVKLKSKNLLILWNLQNFVIDLFQTTGINPSLIREKSLELGVEEKFIFSRLNTTIEDLTKAFEEYRINETPGIVEKLYFDLSRTYIQFVREKAAHGSEKEKQTVLKVVFDVFLEILKLMSPITPFITEKIFQKFKKVFELEKESVHLHGWPKCQKSKIDKNLEKEVEIAQDIISNILALREKNQLGVRWPVQEIVVDTKNKDVQKSVKNLKELIISQVNTKTLLLKEIKTDLEIKPNYKMIGMHFGKKTAEIVDIIAENNQKIVDALKKDEEEIKISKEVTIKKEFLEISRKLPEDLGAIEFRHGTIFMKTRLTASLESEGFAREVIRRVQQLRKNAGMVKQDKIELLIIPDEQLESPMMEWKDTIAEKTGCKKVVVDTKKQGKYEHHLKSKIKGKELELWMKKV